ncbi:MAG: BMP family ABC transporter substrate-binding protein [Lachnospiraceae bacterium]|nr:BMP family ABC transporter substrate-binding protein [Lachnospiraceae bacterium]
MSKRKKKRLAVVLGATVIVVVIVLSIALMGREKSNKAKIGFIMSGASTETGWNGMHYNGVKEACETLGTELLVKENVKEFNGECSLAIEELVEEGAGMIILSSYNYSSEVKDLVKKYPEIVFYGNSSEHHDTNLTSYFVRMYQARYLAGIVAGQKTKSDVIGYVAAMSNNEVNRGISAFTLGVRSVNPEAEVVVAWTGDWDNEAEEREAAKRLVENAGADVLTYHQNQTNVIHMAEELGVYSIGYHEALENQSERYLMSVVCDWDMVYKELIKSFLNRKANEKENYWIGLEVEAVGLSDYSEEVTDEIRQDVEAAKKKIMQGSDVFSGVIYDTEGNLRCGEKEMIADEVLLEQFDWFVEGVKFYEE